MKNDLISESEIDNKKIEQRRHYVNSLQEKEKYLMTLPYADECPRIALSKNVDCRTYMYRQAMFIGGVAAIFTHSFCYIRYGYPSFRNYCLTYFPVFSTMFAVLFV